MTDTHDDHRGVPNNEFDRDQLSSLGPVPSEEDWRSEPWDLDARWAYGKLCGLDAGAFQELLRRSFPLAVGEDVFACPSRVFPYYFRLYLDYIVSSDSDEDSDSACALPDRIIWRATHYPENIRAMWSLVRIVLERIAAEHKRFDAPPEIYGDLAAKYRTAIIEVERILDIPGASDTTT